MRARRIVRLAAVSACFSVALVGCDEPLGTDTPVKEDPFANLDPGVYPTFVLGAAADSAKTVEVVLRKVGDVPAVSSAQLTISFDPERVTVVGGDTPADLLAAWHSAEPGQLRIAAAAVEGLHDRTVLSLRMMTDTILAELFTVEIEELTGTNGFEDLSAHAAGAGHPIVLTPTTSD